MLVKCLQGPPGPVGLPGAIGNQGNQVHIKSCITYCLHILMSSVCRVLLDEMVTLAQLDHLYVTSRVVQELDWWSHCLYIYMAEIKTV